MENREKKRREIGRRKKGSIQSRRGNNKRQGPFCFSPLCAFDSIEMMVSWGSRVGRQVGRCVQCGRKQSLTFVLFLQYMWQKHNGRGEKGRGWRHMRCGVALMALMTDEGKDVSEQQRETGQRRQREEATSTLGGFTSDLSLVLVSLELQRPFPLLMAWDILCVLMCTSFLHHFRSLAYIQERNRRRLLTTNTFDR